ncbi:ARF guanine-nucleotide exchange factor GNOM [Phytophthora citrophthora]|uniref:ARF guanine-nucleotide exchange factor GNOM n=1 Tax=Phytophthora citrophthora TaxID=4793 RepID=A0AAD9G1S9_9STRA|nr:ARF guanine-nucleotide exchange factor GNOM [Phytophthora citrophthora]
MNCVKGEIHNVLSMMRVNARWASMDRFTQEIPASTQSPMMRSFKQLHYELQSVTDLADVDTVTYLLPFIMVIESERTSGFITGAAISAINKFLLYGLITCESLRADVAINRIAVCVSRCRFEETHRADDEAVLMKLLELVEYCVRCDAGHLISGENLWKMLQLCYSIRCQPRSSMHLCRSADNTLSHLVLTVFDRIDELDTQRKTSQPLLPLSPQTQHIQGGAEVKEEEEAVPEYDTSLDIGEQLPAVHVEPTTDAAKAADRPYGIPLLERILHFISGLISPTANEEATCVLGLRLINVVLETAGTGLGNHPCLVSVLQGDLSKFLLQNSETEELGILSLTLRVVFNLFNSIKDHLKVQLEVFFTSVHMRIIDSPSCSNEQKELALESLLEFCREPALMLDLYINYDCDVHCTNLFEVLCKSLAKNCQSMSSPNGSLNALTLLCLEGLLAVIESIARRCPLNTPAKTSGSRTFGSNAGVLSLKGSDLARFTAGGSPGTESSSAEFPMEDISPMSSVRDLMHLVMSGSESDSDSEQSEADNPADQLAWLHTARERTAEVLQQRKRIKKRYALAAEKFNHDQKNWMAFSQQIGLLPEKLTPESVASFLLHTPGLNKTLIGDYIGDGPVEKYPFNAAVRDAYVAMFDFRSAPSLDEALRMFLAKFRLPGEAQKIDRMMEAFSKQLYVQAGSSGPLADADAAYVLSFSIIMLNTDLHSDHIAKKMTVEEFIRNNRGINAGQDLPTEYLTDLYYNILEKEIQMQHDVSDFMESPSSTVDRYSMQWDGVLKRSENVVGASFTSNTSILKLRAGLYEKDMFNLISESTIKSILLAFEKTCDLNNMERSLEGLSNCAKIMLYYDMSDEFNKIMGSLASYFLTFAHGILSGEKVYVPPSTSNVLKRSSSSSPLSPSEKGSSEIVGERIVRRQDDGSEIEVLAAPQHVEGSIDEDLVQGAKTRRALLSLKLLFQFVQNTNEYFRKGWSNVVECMLMFNELDAVPTSLVEIDDFVDSRGVPLPPMQGGLSPHAPSPPKLSPGRGQTGTGLSGKTRERSRRQAERQAAIRSRMKSMTQASQGTAYGSHGQSGNSGSLWGSLSYYLWAEEEKIDESFSLVNQMLRDEVMKLGGGILEKENWLRLTRKLHEQSLMSLLETLVSCRDPFKCIMQPSDSGVDAMMQENAILVLELSVDIILVNSHRILQLNMWDSFHLYAKRILSTPLSELHMQGLVERVVVHILRVSIRLFHDEKVRPKLMATLELLLTMDKDMYKALSDRLASGITMLLKANLVYMHDFHDWEVLLGILQNVVEYINSRSACWDSVNVLAEGGHLNDDNITPWMSLCCGFVRHRTSYAVDALKLLQGLANSDNTYKMNGSSWLHVMRVMLKYLNDDRPPVAKTAWDCLRNSLLLPGMPIAKDTWKQCFDDIIFAFDDQVNDVSVRTTRDAPLYSVTLLSKTFLHNLNVLMELSDFPELWLKVLRRLANKLVASSSPALRSQQTSVVFETTLQSLYNLLLVLKAEDVLERVTNEATNETLFDETCAVIDAVCPHLKEQLGLMPDDVAIEMPAEQPTTGTEAETQQTETHEDDTEAVEAAEETEAVKEEAEDIAADEETLERLIPEGEGQVEVAHVDEPMTHDGSVDKTTSETVEVDSSNSSGPPTSTTTLETVIIGDGTFGIKVDEVIVDEIIEAV